MTTIILDNTACDIYEILCEYYGSRNSAQPIEITNRLLLLGCAGKDLRCILFSYCWDLHPEYARMDLRQWDGKYEKNAQYTVRTLREAEILSAIRTHAEKVLAKKPQTVQNILLSGEDELIRAVITCG